MVKNLPALQEIQVQSLGQEGSWRRAWQPTPVFLPRKSLDRGAWEVLVHVISELDMTEVTERACTHRIVVVHGNLSK